RIADDGQDCGNRREIELELRNDQEAEREYDVVEGGNDGTDGELPFEPYPDVDQDRSKRDGNADDRRPSKFTGNRGADKFGAPDVVVRRNRFLCLANEG